MAGDSIVSQVDRLERSVDEILDILKGDELQPGLRQQVAHQSAAIAEIQERLQEQATTQRARAPLGLLAGLGAMPAALIYQMVVISDWRHEFGLDKSAAMALGALLLLIVVALATFAVKALLHNA